MHRRAELEGNLRRKPNLKGAQAGARALKVLQGNLGELPVAQARAVVG